MFRYLQNIKNLKITFEKKNNLIDYTNVDWTNNSITRKSTNVYLFILYKNAFNWLFKLQICITLSFYKFEYITQTQTSKKVVWISRLLKKLNLNWELLIASIIVKTNNQKTITLNANFKFHNRTKHIDVQ